MNGRRLAILLAVAACVLALGRALAWLMLRAEWYASLGASRVWNETLGDMALVYVLGLLVAFLFSWPNISAVRRSVVALVVPSRVANVEFAEEVPSIRLRWVALAFTAGVAIVSAFFLPSWSRIAIWKTHPVFAESDPYFGLDLGHFVGWLPLEHDLYVWSLIVFSLTAAVVVGLYALTPSLRFARGRVRLTAYVRRHLAVLGGVLLLLVAWGVRLETFHLLVSGSGPAGAFTRIDQTVLFKALLTLQLVSVGAAVVLLIAGWMGQNAVAFASVSLVLLGALVVNVVGPEYARHEADAAPTLERPYLETRSAYSARAFPPSEVPASHRFRASTPLLQTAGRVSIRGALPDIVVPRATGDLVIDGPNEIVAPRVGTGFARFMHAWAEQNPTMLGATVGPNAAIVTVRDVRERLLAIAPILSQGGEVGAVPTARGVLWIVDLYVTSEWYPLSEAHSLSGERITYAHHAAVGYVSGGTGAVAIVPDAVLDPVARGWLDAHRGHYVQGKLPDAWLTPPGEPEPFAAAVADTAFRSDVARVYDHMRAALDSGNLVNFGSAFDSLGALIKQKP